MERFLDNILTHVVNGILTIVGLWFLLGIYNLHKRRTIPNSKKVANKIAALSQDIELPGDIEHGCDRMERDSDAGDIL
ncbi:hypothetical protein H6G33_09855 [Calothrix sp. FACHB-1219]|uniref:hypothetical protein n=1 Tax=unclassified Calothrix TaxID=2619626 RepID=UPI00168820B1|nr:MULTISPECIES: hypothetical protein [unclassified Calothrix]MBD2201650.1 hypothetical protein [Calothrix sp. FACHB-168]MBD2217336.1 hypothetical protein [Calothrix sp. FACHB-1219]